MCIGVNESNWKDYLCVDKCRQSVATDKTQCWRGLEGVFAIRRQTPSKYKKTGEKG